MAASDFALGKKLLSAAQALGRGLLVLLRAAAKALAALERLLRAGMGRLSGSVLKFRLWLLSSLALLVVLMALCFHWGKSCATRILIEENMHSPSARPEPEAVLDSRFFD